MTPADFPGLQPEVFDVAYSSAGMWIARDDTDSPILRYNTSGVLTGYVMGTTVPSAAGLAVDRSVIFPVTHLHQGKNPERGIQEYRNQ